MNKQHTANDNINIELLIDALVELGEDREHTSLAEDIIELNLIDWNKETFTYPETTKQIHHQLELRFGETIYCGALQEEIHKLKDIDHKLMTASNLAGDIFNRIRTLIHYIDQNNLNDYLHIEKANNHSEFYSSLACNLDDFAKGAELW